MINKFNALCLGEFRLNAMYIYIIYIIYLHKKIVSIALSFTGQLIASASIADKLDPKYETKKRVSPNKYLLMNERSMP